MDIQHVRVKIPLGPSSDGLDLEGFIDVFHTWIQQKLFDGLLIDVADYRHVQSGPAVLLVAHEADYGIGTHGGLGFYYVRKSAVEGDNRARYRQALLAAVRACRRLEREEKFGGGLTFDTSSVELAVNDRLLAPNTAATFEALEPGLRDFFVEAVWGSAVTVEHTNPDDPRELFGVRVSGSKPLDLGAAEKRLL